MNLNRKGFTLVELLVTIVIASLVVGLSVFGIVSLINNSEDKTKILSIDNIRGAARIYSAEASSDSWKKTDSNYDAFCVTIGELMNKGLLDKDASVNDGYTRDSFVVVKRNKITLSIETEEMVPDDIGNEYNEICTGQLSKEGNIVKPEITGNVSYTDRIEINFNDGSAPESSVKDYKCLYGDSSSNVNREGVIEGNTCILDGLKNNREYYVLLYMNTNKGSSVLAEGNRKYSTKDFVDTTFIQNNNILIVQYNKSNINGDGYYYFKSDVDTRSLSKIEMCTLNNNKFSCSDSTNDVKSGIWYRTINSNVKLVYSSDDDTFDVNAKICDKSNNCHDNSETINVHNVKFYRNGASSIDGYTSEYVEEYCLAIDGGSCAIVSPEITPKTGYKTVGWNTSSSATTSSWNVGTIKNISSDLEYYAITRANKVYIKYSVNGGSLATTSNANGSWTTNSGGIIYKNGSSEFETINYGGSLTSDGLANYNNSNWINTSKTGYTAVSGEEWKCLSDNCSNSTYNMATVYKASDFCDASSGDCTVILGVNWTPKTYMVTYNGNGGIYNGSSTWVDTSRGPAIYGESYSTWSNDNFFVRDGYTFAGWKDQNGVDWTSYIDKPWVWTYDYDVTLYAQWTSNVTSVNSNKYVCEGTNRLAVYHVTTCNGTTCSYDAKNGLSSSHSFSLDVSGTPSWSGLNKTSYTGTLSDPITSSGNSCDLQTWYVSASSLNCRSGASTSNTTIEYNWSKCTPVNVYRTTMKINDTHNWFYSSSYGCYLYGEYLSSSKPSSCSSNGSGYETVTICIPSEINDATFQMCVYDLDASWYPDDSILSNYDDCTEDRYYEDGNLVFLYHCIVPK